MEKLLRQQTELLQQQTKDLREIAQQAAVDKVIQGGQDKGLLDKSSDGLNANIVKLTKEIIKSVKGQQENTNRIIKSQAKAATNPLARGMSQKAGGQYNASFQEGLDNKIADFKKLGSLEGWFDTSEGNSTGFLGQAVRRKVGENQFVKDQMEVNPTAIHMAQYGAHTKEDFKNNPELKAQVLKKREEDLRAQYNTSQEVAREQRDNEERIKGLTDQGYEEKDLARSGLLKRRASLDEQQADANPAYRAARKRAMAAAEGSDAATPTTGASIVPLEGIATPALGGEEQQSENLRLMTEQTEAIKQIEENTRPLGNLTAFLGKEPKLGEVQQGQGQQEGGLLSTVADFAGDMLGRGKGAAKVAKGAGSLLSKGAGFIGRNAGKLGAIGGIAMGAYDAYSGWGDANDQLARGEITEDQADIKKSGAVGGGVGGAGGAAAGAMAGAAIGSVVPVVGTAIGGLVGGALGYFGGSKVGSAVGEGGAEAYKGVKSWFGEKAAYVKDQTNKDLSGAVGVAQADQLVSSNSGLTSSDKQSTGGTYTATNTTQGIASEKALFGSATLGTIFSKKDQEIGNFLGTGSEEKDDSGKVTAKYGSMVGKRVSSGSLFQSDKYSVTLEGKDGGGVYDEKMSKSQYMELQKLSGEGKYDEAEAKFNQFKKDNAEPSMVDKAVSAASKVGGSILESGRRAVNTIGSVVGTSNLYGLGANPRNALTSQQVAEQQAAQATPTSADQVAATSAANVAAKEQSASAPVIINAPTTNSVQQNQNYTPKSPPRNAESSYQQYNRSKYAY